MKDTGKTILEKEIEKAFCEAVKKAAGKAYKFVSPGASGVPDRLVVLPGNKIGFVEIKAPGRISRPEQRFRQRQLKDMGCYVGVLDDPCMIPVMIREIREHSSGGLPKFGKGDGKHEI